MAVFKDKSGNEWKVHITILDVRNLRENMDPAVHLTDPNSLAELFSDECLQYEVLWHLVEKQAKERNIDAVQFSELFTESFEDAAKALTEALTNFFRSCGRAELSRLIEKTLSASKRLQTLAADSLQSNEMDQMIERMLSEREAEIKKAMSMNMN